MEGFIRCTKCGKKLLKATKDGYGSFIFGKTGKNLFTPVVIQMYGEVHMKCMRRTCRAKHPDHFNIINFNKE